MKNTGTFRRALTTSLLAMALTLGLLALAPSAKSGAASTPTTVTFAEPPQAPPNFIFPFMSLAFFSVYNSEQFQYRMYRPLYWFGEGATRTSISPSPSPPPDLSSSRDTVTVDLNNYKWSNGETVTAENVMFWMNMLHAEKAKLGRVLGGRSPRRRQDRWLVNNPEPADLHPHRPGQQLLVHLQRAVTDHPDAERLGHHRQGQAPDSGRLCGSCLRKRRHPVQGGLQQDQPERRTTTGPRYRPRRFAPPAWPTVAHSAPPTAHRPIPAAAGQQPPVRSQCDAPDPVGVVLQRGQ